MVTSSRGTEGQAGYRSGLGAELSKVITDWTNPPHSFQHREGGRDISGMLHALSKYYPCETDVEVSHHWCLL